MKIFVIDPDLNRHDFDDTPEGNEKAVEWIQEDSRDEMLRPDDYVVIRGELLRYVPPSGKAQLLPES